MDATNDQPAEDKGRPTFAGAIEALSLPPDDPRHRACLAHFERETWRYACGMYAQPIFDTPSHPRQAVFFAIRRTLNTHLRRMAKRSGLDAGHRKLVKEAASRGWRRFKEEIELSELAGATSRREAADLAWDDLAIHA